MTADPIASFFNALAEKWDDIAENNDSLIDFIVKYADIKPEDKVLDIGCGTGILESRILQYNPQKILAVDISENMFLKARKIYIGAAIEFRNADIYSLQETEFNKAFIFNAYPHFLNRRLLAERVSSCLKAGGRFLVAHDHSRSAVNARHADIMPQSKNGALISSELQSAEAEAVFWKEFFYVDTMIDRHDFYLISGIRVIR